MFFRSVRCIAMFEHSCAYPSRLLPCIPLRSLAISTYSTNPPCKSRECSLAANDLGWCKNTREVEAHSTVGKERVSFNVINPAFLDLSTDIGYEVLLQKTHVILYPSAHFALLF
jgi:hypothetical protein